jgi:ABC-2 type transport system ATP-binding protein
MDREKRTAWWKTWAPYWDRYEDQHLGTRALRSLMPWVSGPVLVVGAGQGLLLEALRREGIRATGVDSSRAMILRGRERRGMASLQADGLALPFRSACFMTVIIASGVVDYEEELSAQKSVVEEALRVLAPLGSLLISFYQLPPDVEKAYRRLGVLDEHGAFHMHRIFRFSMDTSPGRAVPLVKKWTGASSPAAFWRFALTGFTLPRALRENSRKLKEVLAEAARAGLQAREIILSVPERLPYRTAHDIGRLLRDLGLESSQFYFFYDCVVARFYKSPIHTASLEQEEQETSKAEAPVIETHDLSKRYPGAGGFAAWRINLDIEPGTIFGILGPNGAGKTTTMMMLAGLLKPTSGTLRFFGDVKAPRGRDVKRRIGYVPQELALYTKLTARENLVYFGGLYGLAGSELEKNVDRLLRLVGLKERESDLVSKYSSGMQRRLNLAAGLVHDPEIILLDEPTVGIDPQSRNNIFDSVQELKGRGATILYTTHYMEEASRLCDRVAIMDRGKILIEGPPGDLVARFGLGRVEFKTKSAAPVSFIRKLGALDQVYLAQTDDQKSRITVSTLSGGKKNFAVIEEIFRLAASEGVDLALAGFFEPTLESLFLDITGRSIRDDAAAGEPAFGRSFL